MNKSDIITKFCKMYCKINDFKTSINGDQNKIRVKCKKISQILDQFMTSKNRTCIPIKLFDKTHEIKRTMFLRKMKLKSKRVFNQKAIDFIFSKFNEDSLKHIYRQCNGKYSFDKMLSCFIENMYAKYFTKETNSIVISECNEKGSGIYKQPIPMEITHAAQALYNYKKQIGSLNLCKQKKLEEFGYVYKQTEHDLFHWLKCNKSSNLQCRTTYQNKNYVIRPKYVKKYQHISYNKVKSNIENDLKQNMRNIQFNLSSFVNYVQKNKLDLINLIVKNINTFKKQSTKIETVLTLYKK